MKPFEATHVAPDLFTRAYPKTYTGKRRPTIKKGKRKYVCRNRSKGRRGVALYATVKEPFSDFIHALAKRKGVPLGQVLEEKWGF